MDIQNMLYQNTYEGQDKFYLITIRGDYFNIATELISFSTMIISNELLAKYKKLDFNKKNIRKVLSSINSIDMNKINLDNFDENAYNYITYDTKLINLNNWADFYDFTNIKC